MQQDPFDPTSTTLLDYVKGRMIIAEQQQRLQQDASQRQPPPQQQQQQHQSQLQPAPQNSRNARTVTPLKPSHTANANGSQSQPYTLPDEENEDSNASGSSNDGSSSDEGPYEFGLADLGDPTGAANGLKSRSPTPTLPPPLRNNSTQHQQFQQPLYHQPHPAAILQNQPFYGSQPLPIHSSTPAYAYAHPQQQQQQQTQISTMNPSLLTLNNGISQTQPQTMSPQQLNKFKRQAPTPLNGTYVPEASTSSVASRPKSKPQVEVLVDRKEGSPAQPAKKRKKVEAEVRPTSILSTTANTPAPPTKSQQAWFDIKKECTRSLMYANQAPHKTVMKLFKLLKPFVDEPEGATSRPESREAFTTDLSMPAEARAAILEVIRDETQNEFDTIFVVDPRATLLLHEWARDLANIAKGKYTGDEDVQALKGTARLLMEVSLVFFRAYAPLFGLPSLPSRPPRLHDRDCMGRCLAADSVVAACMLACSRVVILMRKMSSQKLPDSKLGRLDDCLARPSVMVYIILLPSFTTARRL